MQIANTKINVKNLFTKFCGAKNPEVTEVEIMLDADSIKQYLIILC
jgi:hypothetical protein